MPRRMARTVAKVDRGGSYSVGRKKKISKGQKFSRHRSANSLVDSASSPTYKKVTHHKCPSARDVITRCLLLYLYASRICIVMRGPIYSQSEIPARAEPVDIQAQMRYK